MLKFKILILILFFISGAIFAQEEQNELVVPQSVNDSMGINHYDCTPEELSNFISGFTEELRSPSPLPQASQVRTAVISDKIEEDREQGACSGLLSPSWGEVDFKVLVPNIDSFSLDPFKAAMQEAASRARDELSELVNVDFCEIAEGAGDELLGGLLDEIQREYGVDIDYLTSNPDRARRLIEDTLWERTVGEENRDFFEDPDRVREGLERDAERKIRTRIRDLWGD